MWFMCKKNVLISTTASLAFSIGWWLMLDFLIVYSDITKQNYSCMIPGICATCAMILVLLIPYPQHFDYGLVERPCPLRVLQLLLFFGLLCSFGSVIWTFYICVYVIIYNQPIWIGLCVLIQNLLILASNLIYKFARIKEE